MSDKIINLPINEYSEPKPHEIEIMNSVFNEPGFNGPASTCAPYGVWHSGGYITRSEDPLSQP